MATGIDALTDREKDTLRLILRGHDAKSSARELGLSVHTVNERLREARRKLGVTSSREAARRLLAAEGAAIPESFGDKGLGDAPAGDPVAGMAASATRRWGGQRPALVLAGVTAMSLIFAALFFSAAPASVTLSGPEVPAAAAATSEAAGAAKAAEAFLALLDEGRWADSYAATGAQFHALNSLERWSEVSARVRPPLGALLTRDIVGNEFVPAPPAGYQLVKFRSAYANGTQQTESLSLVREEGVWKVVGVVFD
jgi:DNA-binding CsgD family transcriptional regulator